MDRLLRGEIHSGGACDIKTLATESGISRASLYTTYSHLKDEFLERRKSVREHVSDTDRRELQILRLKQTVATLHERIREQERDLLALRDFQRLAISRIAAQHEEIVRLRRGLDEKGNVVKLRPGGKR